MKKVKTTLAIGIFSISIFPILAKLSQTPDVVSVLYSMLPFLLLLLPYALITQQFKIQKLKTFDPTTLCDIIFSSHLAVWNIAIQEPSTTQVSLLPNL